MVYLLAGSHPSKY